MLSEKFNEKNTKSKSDIKSIQSTTKQQVLQTKLGGDINQSAALRNIRILENNIEKIEAKYNEAVQIKKNYEQIVKQLNDEKIGWESQLNILEKSLKDNEHDINELQLLKHDATHSKQTAQKELNSINKQPQEIELPPSTLSRQTVEESPTPDPSNDSPIKAKFQSKNSFKTDSSSNLSKFEIEDPSLNKYEAILHKLREASGENDINEIIQKYLSLGTVTSSLLDQKKIKEEKLFELNREKAKIKEALDNYRLTGNKDITREELTCKESELEVCHAKNEVAKSTADELQKIEIAVVAGIEHIYQSVSKYINMKEIPQGDDSLLDTFMQCSEKMKKIYNFYRNDPDFMKGLEVRSAVNYNDAYIEEAMGKKGKPLVYRSPKRDNPIYKEVMSMAEAKNDQEGHKLRMESESKGKKQSKGKQREYKYN